MTQAQADSAASTPLSNLVSGFRMPLEALSLLRRERTLWPVAAIPFGLATVALLAASSLLVGQSDALYALVTDWLPSIEAGDWYTWLWVGPAQLGLWMARTLMFVIACGMLLLVALMASSLVAAPALDLLSQRVERMEAGSLLEAGDGSLAAIAVDIGRSLSSEARRLLLLASVWFVLLALGFVIPGGQLITSPLMVLFTVIFLPLEYTGHVLDRRRVSFRARRAWLRAHRARMLGFGASAFLTLMVPGLNFLVMPALVVAGTLIAVRHPPGAADNPS